MSIESRFASRVFLVAGIFGIVVLLPQYLLEANVGMSLMLVAVLEKIAFGVPVALLFARGRVGADVFAFGCIDLVLGVLFVLAYRATAKT